MNLCDITLKEIVSSSIITANKGRKVLMKDRAAYGLHFTLSGKITYTHRAQSFIATPDCAMILPMHATYELYNNESGRFPIINFLCENDSLTDEFIPIKISSAAAYIEDFEKIRSLPPTRENRLRSLALMYRIFDRLSSEENGVSLLLSPAVKYMNEHLSDSKISNDMLAQKANISEIYLRTLFKEHYGTSPHQYLISLRIERAKRLLIESPESVQSIALSCGFSGIYHFTRAFRQSTGITPTEYRKTFINRFV